MPYRTLAEIPNTDPRVTQAISDGLKTREEGIAKDKELLKLWFENDFFDSIKTRTAQGGCYIHILRSNVNPFGSLRYFTDNKESMEYLYGFIVKVKGLTVTLNNNEYKGWYIDIKW